MTRIPPINDTQADSATRATLANVKSKLGMVPNLFGVFAQAPAVLDAYLGLSETLGRGQLTTKQRELIALAVGQNNACQYCLSAHTALGKAAGLSDEEIRQARLGVASSDREKALVTLAVKIVQHKGQLTNQDIDDAHGHGLSNGHIVEVIANVALNILTNYTNHIAGTEIDFPVADLAVA